MKELRCEWQSGAGPTWARLRNASPGADYAIIPVTYRFEDSMLSKGSTFTIDAP
jgi:hypothetical protein